jgi:hypothetical protein
MPAGYTVETTADVALTAATAKTILGIVAASGVACRLVEAGISFDGVSATAEPVTVELCRSSGAGAGTSTSQTPVQTRGATRTVQCSGARNYTAEPTTLTVLKRWLLHPQTGMMHQLPLGREPEHTGAGGLFLRCTAPANVNAQAYMEFEEG